MHQLAFLSGEPRVKPSASQDCVKDSKTNGETSAWSISDLLFELGYDGSYGKMSPAYLPATAGQTSPASSQDSPEWTSPFRQNWTVKRAGGIVESLLADPITTLSPGVCLTLNTSEFPSNADACLLSDILEETGDVPQRYYLSAKACRGILRRAERRGKDLPTMLRRALEQVAEDLNEPGKREGKIQ